MQYASFLLFRIDPHCHLPEAKDSHSSTTSVAKAQPPHRTSTGNHTAKLREATMLSD